LINESYDHGEYGGEFVDEFYDEETGIYDDPGDEWCVFSRPLFPRSSSILTKPFRRIGTTTAVALSPVPLRSTSRRTPAVEEEMERTRASIYCSPN
jgi:hypothetical protein